MILAPSHYLPEIRAEELPTLHVFGDPHARMA